MALVITETQSALSKKCIAPKRRVTGAMHFIKILVCL